MAEAKHNGKMWVAAQFLKYGKPVGEEMHDEEMILVDALDTDPATATTKVGFTKNLGNFESLRVDAGVTVPCYKEELDGAMEFGFKMAERLVFDKVKELAGGM